MSDFAFRLIADLKNYQAEIAKVPGMTEKAAATAATRMVFRMEKGGREAGAKAGAAMADGMSGAVRAGSVNILNQLSDVASQLSTGTNPLTIAVQQGPQVAGALGMMGSAAATAAAALGGLAVAVGLGATAWRVFTADTREAALVSEDMRIAGAGMTSMLDDLRRANVDLSVATGETSKLIGDLERSALSTYTAYTSATKETANRVAELRREQESLTSQVRDAGRTFYETIDPTGLLTEGYDRMWGSTETLRERTAALQDQQRKQIGTLAELVDVNQGVIVANNEAAASADRRREAEKAAREEMERQRRLMEAGQRDEEARIEAQDRTTAALLKFDAAARGSAQARLDGSRLVLARLGDELAALNALEAVERSRTLASVEDAAIAAAAQQARVEAVRTAEAEITAIKVAEAEKAAAEQKRIAEQAAREEAQLQSARARVTNEALSFVTDLTDAAYTNRARIARELTAELEAREGQLTAREEQNLQRRIDANKRAGLALFLASKAAAVAQAVVNTDLAISNALASAPPPANAFLAVAAGIAGAAQVAGIVAAPPPTFHRGTLAARTTRQQEMMATLEPGEAVVQKYAANDPRNQDALARMNGGRGAAGRELVIVDRYDGRAFERSIRDRVRRPGALQSALSVSTPHYGHR